MKKLLLMGAAPLVVVSLALLLPWAHSSRAEELLVRCATETQQLSGWMASDQTACTVPDNVTISRYSLEITLDDGGEVSVNGNQIYSIANDPGTNSETISPGLSLGVGQGFTVRVEARNAVDENGEGIGTVYGKAVLEVYGTQNQQAPALTCSPSSQTANIGQNISFAASGGSGSFSWSGGENPGTGSGGNFTTQFGSAGAKTVTVTSGGQSAACSVQVNQPAQTSPTADIKANGSDGPVTIQSGSAATISWTSSNANSCAVSPLGASGTSGSQSSGNLSSSQAYTVTCTGANGQTATDSVTVNIEQQASLSCAPSSQSIQAGQNVSFTATGGSGSFSWSALAGSPMSGSGTNFNTQFNTSGSTSVTVTSGGQSANCTVNVAAGQVTADIKANGSDGPVTIQSGSGATISWSSTGATSCTVNPGGFSGTSGSQSTGGLNASQTYTVFCTGGGGATATDTVTVNIQNQQTLSCSPSSQTINQNQNVSFSASGGSGSWSWSGGGNPGTASGTSFTTQFPNTGTYSVTVTSGGQSANCTVNVQSASGGAPTVALTSNPAVVASGGASTLTWNSQNATQCSAFGGWSGSKALSGGEAVFPGGTSTYFITCTNASSQQATAQTTVFVNQTGGGVPAVNLTANPQAVAQGQSATLSWFANNATSCFASGGWSGQKQASGSETVSPALNTTYVLTCSNNSGSASDAETVTVTTFTSTVAPQLTKTALNRTLNQTFYSSSIQAQGLDVLEFQIVVVNTSGVAQQITLRDILPSQLFYVPGTTRINEVVAADGVVTGNGLLLGTLNPGEQRIVKFWATVYVGTPQQTIQNQVTATLSNGATQNAFATIQIQNRGQVLGVADIVTGADDPWFLVLLGGFLLSLAYYFAAFKWNLIRVPGRNFSEFNHLAAQIRRRESGPDLR